MSFFSTVEFHSSGAFISTANTLCERQRKERQMARLFKTTTTLRPKRKNTWKKPLRDSHNKVILLPYPTLSCPTLPYPTLPYPHLRGFGTLKYGDAHEKFIFLETQDSKHLRTGQKHFEPILPNFPPDECKI